MTTSRRPTRAGLLEELTAFLVHERGIEPELITEDASLVDDLGLDSLDLMVIAQGWALDYGVDITQETVFDIKTVGQGLTFVLDQVASPPVT
jgi:acyl carrier protein